MSATPNHNPHLETDLWRWALFESGMNRGRAREVLLQGAQSQSFSLFWQAGPGIMAQQLGLSMDETQALHQAHAQWPQIEQRLNAERRRGLLTLRLNDARYPDSLNRFVPLKRRPLLLFVRGETALLELPLILPLGHDGNETRAAWALETLADLTSEGVLVLFVARPGLDAQGIQAFLKAGLPFALVIPQGLEAYTPPAGLQTALDAGRALLISPFQPTWQPQSRTTNPMLPHAISFAQTLAHAWLALGALASPPAAGQVCLCAPELSGTPSCPQPYQDPEALFLLLAEATTPIHQNHTPTPQPAPERPPLSPEEILQTLTLGGKIPAALAARLKTGKNHGLS